MRSMWKGAISFGLVTIPVKLYAATESKDLHFNLLHQECRSPIQYRKWCPNCDREIAADEIIKGYEFDRGRYVTIAEAEFDAIPVAAKRTLEIVGFVKLAEIDPVYFEKTYYLEPGEGGAKAYALLRRAMEETGRVAVARVVIRSKESLAAVRVFGDRVLALETMHFPDEVRSVAGLTGMTEPELKAPEIEMAINLVESLATPFAPERFENEYRQALLNLVEAKVSGEEVHQVAAAPDRGRVVDLMEALRASLRSVSPTPAAAAGQPELVPPPVPGAPGVAAGPPPGVAPGAPPGVPAPGLPGVPLAPVYFGPPPGEVPPPPGR